MHKWRWVTAWIRFMRRGAAKGAEECCHWPIIGVAIHRCLPMRHPLLRPARQPRMRRCNWPTTPAPGTHDRLSSARSRPTLALSSRAHGVGSDESSAGPAITSPPCCPARHLTAPNTRSTAHSLTKAKALLSSYPVAKLAFSLRNLEKAHRRHVTVSTAPVPPWFVWCATAASAK